MTFRKSLLTHRDSTVFETKSGSLFIKEHRPASVAVVVLHKGEITLVKQFRHQLNSETFELPGGGIETNEKPLDGAKRELKEETGLEADQFTYLGTFNPQPYFTNRCSHLFFTNVLTHNGAQNLDEGEEIEVIQMPLKEVLDSIRTGKFPDGELGYALFLCHLKGLLVT